MHFSGFSHKAYTNVDFGCVKILDAIFWAMQSLLLSTTVLNDTVYVKSFKGGRGFCFLLTANILPLKIFL